jgi:nucleotide-binding universal stress UspA family protein
MEKNMKTAGRNLIMAIDCFSKDQNLKNALHSATSFSAQAGWAPEAVSVVSPDQFSWPYDFKNDQRTEFRRWGEDVLDVCLKRNFAPKKIASDIALQEHSSKREKVLTILNAAKRKKASAIAVFTHIENDSTFNFPGGFVSSLIYQSQLPVLAINSKAQYLRTVKTILVATDFSEEGAKTFDKNIELAAKLKAKLILLHILPTLPHDSFIASAGIAGGWDNIQIMLDSEEKRLRIKAAKWLAKAEAMGVRTSFEFLTGTLAVAETILSCAKQFKADLIIVTEKTGPWEAVVLGSVTRDLLKNSERPILVMPTAQKKRKPTRRPH